MKLVDKIEDIAERIKSDFLRGLFLILFYGIIILICLSIAYIFWDYVILIICYGIASLFIIGMTCLISVLLYLMIIDIGKSIEYKKKTK